MALAADPSSTSTVTPTSAIAIIVTDSLLIHNTGLTSLFIDSTDVETISVADPMQPA